MALKKKTILRYMRDVQTRARQDKPVAELIARLDALVFSESDPRAFDAFLRARYTREIFGYLESNPRSEVVEILAEDARNRVRMFRQAGGHLTKDSETVAWVSCVIELASTAKIVENQVAVGLGYDFIESLLTTDFDDYATPGLKDPFEGPFIIRLPRGFYLEHEWQNQQRLRPLEIVAMAPVLAGGPGDFFFQRGVIGATATEGRTEVSAGSNRSSVLSYITTFRTGVAPEDADDPNILVLANTLGGIFPLVDEQDGATTFGELSKQAWFPYSQSKYVQLDEEDRVIRSGPVADLKKIVYGLLFYLNTHNPSLTRASNRKRVTLPELVQAPASPRKLRATLAKPAMAPTVVVSEEVERLPRTAYKTLVRGHPRDQPYGPGRSKIKRIWIKPHIRHKDAPGDPRKDYEIEGLDELPPGWSCAEAKRELWGIVRDKQHVQAAIEANMFSDPEYTIELQERLEELEEEYARLYECYMQQCGGQ